MTDYYSDEGQCCIRVGGPFKLHESSCRAHVKSECRECKGEVKVGKSTHILRVARLERERNVPET